MSDNLFSQHWYQVKDLRPQLQPHVSIQRQDYRGMIWYILDDRINNRTHRFNALAYQIIGQFDGSRQLDQIWNESCDQLGDFALTQDDVIQLLAQLHKSDLLQIDAAPDIDELCKRHSDNNRAKWKQRLGNPLAVRVGLWDPDAFLLRSLPFTRWFFHPLTVTIALLVILVGFLLAAMHWAEIAEFTRLQASDPISIVFLVLLYPIVKLIHELAHGYSARKYDCEVHEMGLSFLLFMPVPYVDVSSVNRLRNKYSRILVSSVGVICELLLAVMGLFIWLATEPGLLNLFGFTVFIIGGVSSLLFNGNPLLKYDAYYVLADSLAIPNLYQRSRAYLTYLLQRYLLGISDVHSPATGTNERRWLFSYGLASVSYRLFLLWFISLYLLDINYYLGVTLASWMLISQVLLPITRGLLFVFSSPLLTIGRYRALLSTGLVISVIMGLIGWLPLPSYTLTQGVVWIPEESQLRAGANGFVSELHNHTGETIRAGTTILQIEDHELHSRTAILRSRLNELNSEYQSNWSDDRVKAGNILSQMKTLAQELSLNLKRISSMQLTSEHSGHLIVPDGNDLPGSYVNKGHILGYVLKDTLPLVRVVVKQADIGLLRQQTQSVSVRLASNISTVYPAQWIRSTPQASHQLPSPALAKEYGGTVTAGPNANGSLQAIEKIFTVDLRLSQGAEHARVGQRVYVRFDHGAEPLLSQWYRDFRNTFLRRLNA